LSTPDVMQRFVPVFATAQKIRSFGDQHALIH